MRRIPLSAIRDAAQGIAAVARRTPLIPLEVPDSLRDRLGDSRIFLKLELFQPIGSFKIRGAWNAIRQMSSDELKDGVWTVSAGNAALGVALAARTAGVPCTVMVMDTAPAAKLEAIERLGASIVLAPYEECWRTVETHRSDRMPGRMIHPFDDDRFIAGNATVALEILDDLPDVDAVVAPMGGGGLLAGIGSALSALKPQTKVYAAEPETAAPFALSRRRGESSVFDRWQSSFVDGAGGKSVLPTMWPILSDLNIESIVVPLEAAAAAMTLVAQRCHIIAEGAAACAVAASLSGEAGSSGTESSAGAAHHHTICAVVSGGNIDLSRFASLTGACQ